MKSPLRERLLERRPPLQVWARSRLVIYGSGHIPVLEHALSVAENLTFADTAGYLPPAE